MNLDPGLRLAQLLDTPIADAAVKENGRLRASVTASLFTLRGGVRILGEDDTAAARVTRQAHLLKAIALGRKWIADIVRGDVESLRAIATRDQHAQSYIYDAVRAACLAPELVHAVIDGKPMQRLASMTAKATFPTCWTEQVGSAGTLQP